MNQTNATIASRPKKPPTAPPTMGPTSEVLVDLSLAAIVFAACVETVVTVVTEPFDAVETDSLVTTTGVGVGVGVGDGCVSGVGVGLGFGVGLSGWLLFGMVVHDVPYNVVMLVEVISIGSVTCTGIVVTSPG